METGRDDGRPVRAVLAVGLYCLVIVAAWTGAGLLGAPRSDLWVQLLTWGSAAASTTRPVERLLGAGDPEGRPWLQITVSSVLIAAAVVPTGLGFMFPVAAGLLATQTLHLHPTRTGLAAGLAAVAVGTTVVQVLSRTGLALRVLPPTTADLSAMVLAVLCLVGLVNAHRVGHRLRVTARDLAAEQHRRHEELLHAATHDQLTGLLGRRGLDEPLARALAAARPGSGAGLVFLDLDGFKPVNDTHGHHTGDSVLREVADRLRRTVGGRGQPARVGGDEFVVLLAACSAGQVRQVAADCADALNAPITVDGTTVPVGVSVGTAHVEEPVAAHELTRAADTSMYADKRRRRAGPPPAPARTPPATTDRGTA